MTRAEAMKKTNEALTESRDSVQAMINAARPGEDVSELVQLRDRIEDGIDATLDLLDLYDEEEALS